MSEAPWLTDQIRAAVADARQRVADGGPVHPAHDIPAVDRLRELLLRQLAAGLEGQCGHIPERAVQPVHWLAAVPNLVQCDACAQMITDDWLRLDYHQCDLCQRSLSDEPASVLVQTAAGVFIITAVTCTACAPPAGGAQDDGG
jgi:hypothetical protein